MNTIQHYIHKKPKGFTIVELLIVIVVIAILAVISVVAYTGMQNRTHDSTVQQDLRQIGQRLELYRAEHGYYPTPENEADMASLNISASRDSYAEEGINQNNTHNLIYCHPHRGSGSIALVARATSGTIWQWTGTISEYDGPSGGGTSANHYCPAMGLESDVSYSNDGHNRTIFRSADQNWVDWLN